MTRDELEHIIRASADVTDQYEFIIVDSQSILRSVPKPSWHKAAICRMSEIEPLSERSP